MKYLDSQFKNRLDDKLETLNSLRPLPPSSVQKLKEQFSIEMTYNSNAIEGNSLTLKETFFVINEGITIKGKPLKDHLEAKDHSEALSFLYETVEHGKKQTISEVFIRQLHQLLVKETEPEEAGKYRSGNVIITGSDHLPPNPTEISQLMSSLIKWVSDNEKKLHPVELASIFHHKLVFIHPFFDGNGRTARLAMNLLLMQKGFPLVIVLKNDRKRYYDVLQKADKGDYSPLVRFIAQSVERTLNLYLKTLAPSIILKEKFFPLLLISKKTPYSKKYLNLLARYGKIEAYKEKRNWLTTYDAVKRYMDQRRRKRV